MPNAEFVRDSNEETNLALLQQCRANDPEACNELLRKYNRIIFNTAYRILREEAWAEDALQETMLNVYRGLANFRGDAKLSTWISRITVNVCLGMLRKGCRQRLVALEDDLLRTLPAEAGSSSDPHRGAALSEMGANIQKTFARMSHRHRAVVRLHDMEGYTIQEIAGIIGCPVGTVKSRLFYGRQEFKSIYSALVAQPAGSKAVH